MNVPIRLCSYLCYTQNLDELVMKCSQWLNDTITFGVITFNMSTTSDYEVSFLVFAETSKVRSNRMSFFRGIRLVMGHGPYAKLVMGFLFTSLAFMVSVTLDLQYGVWFCGLPIAVFGRYFMLLGFTSRFLWVLIFLCAAPGGQLCSVLFVHPGLQRWLSKCPTGSHGM